MMAAAGENFQNDVPIALLYYYRVKEIFFLGDFRRKLNFHQILGDSRRF